MAARVGRQGGFTLLEILVAFIIAAIAIAALLQGASGGLQSVQAAGHYQEAVSRAQSRMALLQTSLSPGEQQGDDGGGFTWRVRVQPSASSPIPRPPGPQGAQAGGAQAGGTQAGAGRSERLVLYAVAVSIAWQLDGGNREVTLYSQRLGTAAPDGP